MLDEITKCILECLSQAPNGVFFKLEGIVVQNEMELSFENMSIKSQEMSAFLGRAQILAMEFIGTKESSFGI